MSFFLWLREKLRSRSRYDVAPRTLSEVDALPPSAPASDPRPAALPHAFLPQPRLLPAAEGPFGRDVWDLSPGAGPPQFPPPDAAAALRGFEGYCPPADPSRTAPLKDPTTVPCDLAWPVAPPGLAPDACLVVATDMDEKWQVAVEEGALVFRRSWTGEGAYRLPFVQGSDGMLRASELSVAASTFPLFPPAGHAAVVDFLVRRFALGEVVVAPLPESLRTAPPGHLPLWCFSVYGRGVRFAAFLPQGAAAES